MATQIDPNLTQRMAEQMRSFVSMNRHDAAEIERIKAVVMPEQWPETQSGRLVDGQGSNEYVRVHRDAPIAELVAKIRAREDTIAVFQQTGDLLYDSTIGEPISKDIDPDLLIVVRNAGRLYDIGSGLPTMLTRAKPIDVSDLDVDPSMSTDDIWAAYESKLGSKFAAQESGQAEVADKLDKIATRIYGVWEVADRRQKAESAAALRREKTALEAQKNPLAAIRRLVNR